MRFEIIKGIVTCVCLFWGSLPALAQSRIYLSVGTAGSSPVSRQSVSDQRATSSAQPTLELEFEKKIIGSVCLLTGLSTFGVSYSNDYGPPGSVSRFNARYLAVPLLARWNIRNRNSFYFDIGIQPYYLLDAHLEESITRFGDLRTAQGDITAYSNRFFMSTRFQVTKAFNRINISFFVFSAFAGQSSIKDLADHWPFNEQQSTYLISEGYSSLLVLGLKVGVRIK